jgi:hypothetical protein
VSGRNASSGSISRLASQFADRRPGIARAGLPNAPNLRNSNREALRLETALTRTKQGVGISSNREKEALFSPAKPPQITIRADRGSPNPPDPFRQEGERNSNRERFRRVRAVNRLRDCRAIDSARRYKTTNSNREKGACCSATNVRPRWDARAGTPTSGVAGGLTPALPYDGKTARSTSGRKKTNSRPPGFVAIKPEADRLFCMSCGRF